MAGSLVLVMAIVFILFFSTSVGMLLAGELLVSPIQQPAWYKPGNERVNL